MLLTEDRIESPRQAPGEILRAEPLRLLLNAESAADYLARRKEHIPHEYSLERPSMEGFKCAHVALRVAQKILEEGGAPDLMVFKKEGAQQGLLNPAVLLYPQALGIQTSWWCHVVCRSGDRIHDPMIGRPVSAEGYSREAFGEDVKPAVYWDAAKTKSMIQESEPYIEGDRIFRALISEKLPPAVWHLRGKHDPAGQSELTFRYAKGAELAQSMDLSAWTKQGDSYTSVFTYAELSWKLSLSDNKEDRMVSLRAEPI